MKVLLIKDVKSLGNAGEIKEVKDGYGNNFLISKSFAKAATPSVIRQWEAQQKRAEEDLKYEVANLETLKAELEKVLVIIKKTLGANNQLFGSVSKDEIAKELKTTHKLIVDKKNIEIEHNNIKSIGLYTLNVKLGHAINAELKVEVVAE